MFLVTLAVAGVAIIVAFASWLLVGQTDAEREPQVFVVGALLLVGGAAAYLSLSALFAGCSPACCGTPRAIWPARALPKSSTISNTRSSYCCCS
jgi:hypothetical protein